MSTGQALVFIIMWFAVIVATGLVFVRLVAEGHQSTATGRHRRAAVCWIAAMAVACTLPVSWLTLKGFFL